MVSLISPFFIPRWAALLCQVPLASTLGLLHPIFAASSKTLLISPSVSSYSIASATLSLVHPRPDDRSPVRALVNVDLVLARLGSEQTRVGEWVNVLGYITSVPSIGSKPADGPKSPTVSIQALLLWSAGPVDVQRYEASVQSLTA